MFTKCYALNMDLPSEKTVNHLIPSKVVISRKDYKKISNPDYKPRSSKTKKILDEFMEFFHAEVNPAAIPLSTEDEKHNLITILEKAEADGEIDLSRFSVPAREHGETAKYPEIGA